DQHPRGNQIAEGMHAGTDGESDGLPGADRALGQIRSEADGLPVMPGANGVGKLRSLPGNGAQFERPFAAQQNADQSRPQEKTKTIGESLDYGGNVRRPV